MGKVDKAVLGSVRLDSDVWKAVRAMPESLNQYLRRRLLAQAGISDVDEYTEGVSAVKVGKPITHKEVSRGYKRTMRPKGDKTR